MLQCFGCIYGISSKKGSVSVSVRRARQCYWSFLEDAVTDDETQIPKKSIEAAGVTLSTSSI